ncbi:hypothetical protein LK09_03280 [Microbacterium mangrovi]|uniref:Glycosyltransferase 2-like domain-containing protein n=1 Tax=Microbacterium mangrovi TaxID=1348253 RepID=A0A0B2A747_9MICO|nr:glycosyltransferase family A protein [Microbacterium mangrovi]KHK99314.1 hypothetical protein LK09_03280 [Microbacterium mangrovi]
MTTRPDVSLITCTDARSDPGPAVARLVQAARSSRFDVEVLLVDNSASGIDRAWDDVRVIRAELPGLSRARTVACTFAAADKIIFVDDDVVFDGHWVDRLAEALDAGADVVASPIALADDLAARNLPALIRGWLAENLGAEGQVEVVGAGFGFTRRMLQHALWDQSLGAGPHSSGYGEEQLFALMCRAAGARIVRAPLPPIVHHADPRRASVENMLEEAVKKARSEAYIAHHWHGQVLRLGRARRLVRSLRARRRARRVGTEFDDNALRALHTAYAAAFATEMVALRRIPRLYGSSSAR